MITCSLINLTKNISFLNNFLYGNNNLSIINIDLVITIYIVIALSQGKINLVQLVPHRH
jgi:hypothetical protein